MIALGAEEWCAVGWDAVELGVDGSNNDRTANCINTRISNTWCNEFAFNGQRTEVLLYRCISIVALPVNWVDADASRGKCAVISVAINISFALGVLRYDDTRVCCALSKLQTSAGEEVLCYSVAYRVGSYHALQSLGVLRHVVLQQSNQRSGTLRMSSEDERTALGC